LKFRTAGTDHWNALSLPLFEGENEGAGGGQSTVTGGGGSDTQNGSGNDDALKAFEGLEADNLAWLQKAGLTDVKALAKHAQNQESLLGAAVRVPGKDATDAEREAFLNKLGRPETADKYEFKAPSNLPEGFEYDAKVEEAFRGIAHKAGLTQAQAAAVRDEWLGLAAQAYTGQAEAGKAAQTARADKATEELVKLWGPLDGATARANLEVADQVFTQTKGGTEFLAALKELGLVAEDKTILDARIAPFIAGIGAALYTEDGVLRGSPDLIGNIFDETSPEFNVTAQMKLAKEDPAKARSLIAAAGKKPEDYGLPANFGA
jgi:hypothetical protein